MAGLYLLPWPSLSPSPHPRFLPPSTALTRRATSFRCSTGSDTANRGVNLGRPDPALCPASAAAAVCACRAATAAASGRDVQEGLLLLEGRTKAMTLLQRRTKKQKPCQLGQERLRLGMQLFLPVLFLVCDCASLCWVLCVGVDECVVCFMCCSSASSPTASQTPDAHDLILILANVPSVTKSLECSSLRVSCNPCDSLPLPLPAHLPQAGCASRAHHKQRMRHPFSTSPLSNPRGHAPATRPVPAPTQAPAPRRTATTRPQNVPPPEAPQRRLTPPLYYHPHSPATGPTTQQHAAHNALHHLPRCRRRHHQDLSSASASSSPPLPPAHTPSSFPPAPCKAAADHQVAALFACRLLRPLHPPRRN